MAYLGRGIENLSDRVVLDALTASATASYTLQLNSVNFVPSSASSLTVSLNGVIQKPDSSYTVSSSTLTFSSALTSSDSIDFIIAERGITLQTPSAGSVNTDQLAANAVTSGKMFSGFNNGITEFDMWKLTSDLTFANDTVTVITANLARHSYQTDKKGTGMSESSGIFTFPSTGLYYIDFTGFIVGTGGASYLGGGIHATTDNSSYNIMAQNFSNTQGNTDHANFRCHTTFNVTNTSTHKVRFFQFSQNATGRLESDANQFRTGFTFMRIGD